MKTVHCGWRHHRIFLGERGHFQAGGEALRRNRNLAFLQKWIQEDRSGFLIKVLENPNSSLVEIAGAIERYRHLIPQGVELSSPRERAFRVSLIQRILNDDPQFVQVAKQFISVNDFHDLLERTIYPAGSHGRLGGKGAGLFVASQILKTRAADNDLLESVKTPKTWHLTSDGLHNFINYNDLEEIAEHKYKDVGQVRVEYPAIIQVFKSASFPPEIVNGFVHRAGRSAGTPLIVRSSSLLEDSRGTSFAGKYKSLFIANQGSKHQRMPALMDAVAEVYASTFGPDPIGYRMQRGLTDFHEEMGIMIQEVVGTRVGPLLPAGLCGRRFQPQRISMVPPHPPRRWPAAHGAGVGHTGGRPRYGRLSDTHFPRPAVAPCQRDRRGEDSLFPQTISI